MEKEKFYCIKCYMYIKIIDEFKPYGYFDEIIVADNFQGRIERDIFPISEIKYAKKYKRKVWAEKMIQKIYDKTKDNPFLFDDDGKYKYKFEIIEI